MAALPSQPHYICQRYPRFHPEPPAPSIHRPPILDPEAVNWYWDTLAPTIAERAQAHSFFTKAQRTFLRSITRFREWPQSDVPEVAFVGRSNVGKSSLLNAIVGADLKAHGQREKAGGGKAGELARTSKHPGHTKTMNLYGIGTVAGGGVRIRPSRGGNEHEKIVGRQGLVIVDLPGYGEGSQTEWGIEIVKYLTQRKQLRRTFILVDAYAGLKDKDRSLMASLRLAGVPYQIILSKIDRIYLPASGVLSRVDGRKGARPIGSLPELQLKLHEIRADIQPRMGGGALGELLACSSEVRVNGRRFGIDAVRFAILQAVGWEFERGAGKRIYRVPTEKRPVNHKKMDA
ncbi:uncharacterized protein BDR25DRAFT_335431 [Lindgomyces ingoldianus]|uniref:Uncharacterized protein n=1 Tax=Lindgomyces ingoldianus TaxID=673940 RepID=A0ACB6QNS8_9PLEO|nr:uncharacterized protein BDR25DRAFT_335431 [Lindgomyces ingoldianus]KAF2468639.1 hypothetical protein BDR25DRAFT_335431 [Lindgomyces ingoldianus]